MDVVSIIVPIYNVESYLDRCVESIVSQTYTQLEIILVDDGSPDACPGMCDKWAERDTRIKVIHKENGGLSDARNAGLSVATGEYIAFVDSDDWIAPEFVQMLYTAMQEHHAEIAECVTVLVDEDGVELRRRGVTVLQTLDTVEALRRLVLEDGVYQTVWNKLYKREVIDSILFEKGKYNEDDFFTYRVFDRAETLVVTDAPLYYYVQRGGSIMGVGYNVRRLDGLQARFERMHYLQKHETLASLVKQQFMLDCMWQLQCTYKFLSGEDKETAKTYLLSKIRETPRVAWRDLTLNLKYRVWYKMFCVMPTFTAKVRNALGMNV